MVATPAPSHLPPRLTNLPNHKPQPPPPPSLVSTTTAAAPNDEVRARKRGKKRKRDSDQSSTSSAQAHQAGYPAKFTPRPHPPNPINHFNLDHSRNPTSNNPPSSQKQAANGITSMHGLPTPEPREYQESISNRQRPSSSYPSQNLSKSSQEPTTANLEGSEDQTLSTENRSTPSSSRPHSYTPDPFPVWTPPPLPLIKPFDYQQFTSTTSLFSNNSSSVSRSNSTGQVVKEQEGKDVEGEKWVTVFGSFKKDEELEALVTRIAFRIAKGQGREAALRRPVTEEEQASRVRLVFEIDAQDITEPRMDWPEVNLKINGDILPLFTDPTPFSTFQEVNLTPYVQEGDNQLSITKYEDLPLPLSLRYSLEFIHLSTPNYSRSQISKEDSSTPFLYENRIKDKEMRMMALSLVDPVRFERIEIPVRGSNCQHLETFDLETHLSNEFEKKKRGRWPCPRCGKPCPPSDLAICTWTQSLLRDNPEAEEIGFTFEEEEEDQDEIDQTQDDAQPSSSSSVVQQHHLIQGEGEEGDGDGDGVEDVKPLDLGFGDDDDDELEEGEERP